MQSPLAVATRTLQIRWLSLVLLVLLGLAALLTLLFAAGSIAEPPAPAAFYLNAGFNFAALVGVMLTQRRLFASLRVATEESRALDLIQRLTLRALVLLGASAVLAGVATLIGGELINLLFALPFFALAWLFYPNERRVAIMLAQSGAGGA
jgi:hypothetical protein